MRPYATLGAREQETLRKMLVGRQLVCISKFLHYYLMCGVFMKKKLKNNAVLGRPEGLQVVQKDCVATGIFFLFLVVISFFWGGRFGRPIRQCVTQLVVSAMCAHRYGHMRP